MNSTCNNFATFHLYYIQFTQVELKSSLTAENVLYVHTGAIFFNLIFSSICVQVFFTHPELQEGHGYFHGRFSQEW